ncbi:phenol hydroxylase subunit P4 [Marinobacterium jannaschii]|uniref:phenol hydroxylase subunit P4 n=1 Tax=Marinobacterium jannaschii TaxID=64970 RepID=UPI00048A31A5|nr:phenol hydroxylase subunit P4 [Marinobacterium jannaschii]
MSVRALQDNYRGEVLDARENFGGNIIVYFGWEEHQFFCAAKAFPLSPEMGWGDVIDQIMPEAFAQHPEFEKIDWSQAQWTLDNAPLQPQREQSLQQLGAGHKSCFRFTTPGLNGYQGAGV